MRGGKGEVQTISHIHYCIIHTWHQHYLDYTPFINNLCYYTKYNNIILSIVTSIINPRRASHVFSRTVAAVDTKRGYVGMCNGRSAQQESGAALSKNSMFTAGA